MANPRLDRLSDYPFKRLAALLSDLAPPAGLPPVAMSVGEPQHPPPGIIDRILGENAHLWGKYPPVQGADTYRAACTGWLTRRFGLPDGMLDPGTMVLPASGTREILFQTALLTVPERKQGQVVNVEGGGVAQVMDLETYETITMNLPDGADVANGDEIEFLEYEGQRKVV